MAGQTKRTEFTQALKAITTERGLDANVIVDAIEQSMIAAYKRDARESGVAEEEIEKYAYEAELDPISGEAHVYQLEKVESEDEDEPVKTTGERKDVTPPGFGRIAAQTAKQVIHQKIREAEKGAIMGEYEDRVGGLVSGTVLRFDGANVRVDLGKTEAIMPAQERSQSERLNPNQRLTFLLKSIEDTPRGKQIVLSRADNKFVEKVFEREVPEISSGSVEIKGIAREPGVRTKIAVHSAQPGVDPVGSCVGQKGVRVQTVTNELGGERVDIVPWTEDDKEFIKATLAPVEVISIELKEEKVKEEESEGEKKVKTAVITVPEDQLSLAIGKEGGNVRLASQLTGWRIEVEGDGSEVVEEKAEATEEENNTVEEATEKVEKEEQVEENIETAEESEEQSQPEADEDSPESE